MQDDKYVVFKREDWEQFAHVGMAEGGIHDGGDAGIDINALSERVVRDAVVIRRKDVFAPPALEMYAMSIDVALSLTPGGDPRREALKRISAYFHQQATEAWDTDRSVPD